MRIGYIVKEFPRLSETFILTELLELERLGHEVTVFSRHTPAADVPHAGLRRLSAKVEQLQPLLRDRLWESFQAHLAASRKMRQGYDREMEAAISLRSRNEMRYWLLAAPLAERVEELGIDLLHAHFATGSASLARYAGTLSGRPYSFTAHAKDIYARSVDTSRLRGLCERAAAVVTVSEYNRRHLAGLAPRANVCRVYNGLDLERFPVAALRGAHQPRLLFVGRYVEKKGLRHLIEATAQLIEQGRPVSCRLVGEGPLGPALREQVKELGIEKHVEFVPAASQEEVIASHFPESTAFVLPAVIAEDGDRDGLPTTLLEASACGLPMISTCVTGIPEILADGEAGWLVEPGDTVSLADAIAACLDDPPEAARRARRARRRCQELFDARRNATELERIFLAGLRDVTHEESA